MGKRIIRLPDYRLEAERVPTICRKQEPLIRIVNKNLFRQLVVAAALVTLT